MSDSRKRIFEDEQDYLANCKYFGEDPTEGVYSKHAALLETLRAAEREMHAKHRTQLQRRRVALNKLTAEDRAVLGLKD